MYTTVAAVLDRTNVDTCAFINEHTHKHFLPGDNNHRYFIKKKGDGKS